MEDKKKLYVGNLPYSVNSDELRKIFSEFGEVLDAIVLSDKFSGRSKGFGFVTFATEEMAQSAVEGLNGKEVGGRNLVVNVARPPKQR